MTNIDRDENPMARIVSLYEAKTQLSRLVEEAAGGEEIIIAKAGHPRARLVPLTSATGGREPGGWEGRVWISDDFDDELSFEDLTAWYGGEADEES